MRDVMIEAMMLRLYVGNRLLDWGSCVVGERSWGISWTDGWDADALGPCYNAMM
jgi:hypothetical protein